MSGEPRTEQLSIPAIYGSPSKILDWETVRQKLIDARQYWLATVRPDGRPHVVPLDGLWRDDRWYFGGSPETVKHQNLQAEPRVALHLPDAEAAVIVEGACEVIVPSQDEAEALADASKQKYGYGVPASVYRTGVWQLTPSKAMAWSDLTVDPTRFLF
jgi:nitroimidazol reductase NimA-like FMN-containing flavoprotein (pyridoxamine 5'-phosphate oxidase superfamily)